MSNKENEEQSIDRPTSYDNLIKNIEINKVYVKRLNMECIVPPSKLINYLDGNKQVEIDVHNDFQLAPMEGQEKEFFSQGTVTARANVDDQVLFLIEVELTAQYDTSMVLSEISEEDYERFVNTNVPVNLWPYAREIIHTGTTRMGYPPLILKPYRRL